MNSGRKFLALSGREKLLTVQVALLLPLLDLALHLRGYKWTRQLLTRALPATPVGDRLSLQAICRVVDGTGARLASATCLRRSLLLWWLLRRRGFCCEIKIGVRSKASAFSAHAWVEWQGSALNARPDLHEHYAIFEHWPVSAK